MNMAEEDKMASNFFGKYLTKVGYSWVINTRFLSGQLERVYMYFCRKSETVFQVSESRDEEEEKIPCLLIPSVSF